MIYLDNAATTPVCKSAIDETVKIYEDLFFNPSATYKGGVECKKIIADARQALSAVLNCNANKIYFTSCASESNNWVFSSSIKNQKQNIVISAGEHASVYECAKKYKNKGFDVRFAPLLRSGQVDVSVLLSLVDENTSLVSVIHVSNETGVVNDVASICAMVKEKNGNTLFHSDGVQAFLKVSTDLEELGVDFYSVSGHKIGAPKGVGLLYAKKNIQPLIVGGGQEGGFRSGTENVAGIASLAVATREFLSIKENVDVPNIIRNFEDKLKNIADVKIIGESAERSGFITCLSVLGTRAEIIQTMCNDDGLIIGRGSACSSKHRGNRVLQEMGLSLSEIDGAIRLSYSPSVSEEELDFAYDVLKNKIDLLRGHKIG